MTKKKNCLEDANEKYIIVSSISIAHFRIGRYFNLFLFLFVKTKKKKIEPHPTHIRYGKVT